MNFMRNVLLIVMYLLYCSGIAFADDSFNQEQLQRQRDEALIDQVIANRRAQLQQQQIDERISDLENQNAQLRQQQQQMMGFMGAVQEENDRLSAQQPR